MPDDLPTSGCGSPAPVARPPGRESTGRRYDLLALDVDGTLVGTNRPVAPETIRAVAAARRAGLRVCLATGRSYVETIPVWGSLQMPHPHDPMVLIGGALVSEPGTGRTLREHAIDRDLACEYADALAGHGYSALAIVDAWRWGLDYYLAEGDDADELERLWFGKMDVAVRRTPRLSEVQDLRPPLRINAVLDGGDGAELARRMREQFADRLRVHAILAPNYGVWIVEAFDVAVSKWAALRYVAQGLGVPSGRIVAVGDDVNDLEMIRRAGLGVAMSKAPEHVRESADHVISGSLAEFITDLAAGKFD